MVALRNYGYCAPFSGWQKDDGDLTQTRTHSDANEITGISETHGATWADPVYSDRGNMTTVPRPTDLTATFAAAYDAWNRLVLVYLDNNSNGVYDGGDTLIGKYEYDGLGRRVKKWIDTDAPSDPDGVDIYRHFYYNAGWQILETRKSTTEGTQPETLQPEYQYVWSLRYIDAPVLRDENKDNDDYCLEWNDGDERLYYLTDANMNVTCLTDTGGDSLERYHYDPYGSVTILTGGWGARGSTSYANSLLFCGYYRDKETELYHVRNRFYHPHLGRWLQRDPLGYVDGMSLYEYVGSSPLVRVDGFGLKGGGAPTTPYPYYSMQYQYMRNSQAHYDQNTWNQTDDDNMRMLELNDPWMAKHIRYNELVSLGRADGSGPNAEWRAAPGYEIETPLYLLTTAQKQARVEKEIAEIRLLMQALLGSPSGIITWDMLSKETQELLYMIQEDKIKRARIEAIRKKERARLEVKREIFRARIARIEAEKKKRNALSASKKKRNALSASEQGSQPTPVRPVPRNPRMIDRVLRIMNDISNHTMSLVRTVLQKKKPNP